MLIKFEDSLLIYSVHLTINGISSIFASLPPDMSAFKSRSHTTSWSSDSVGRKGIGRSGNCDGLVRKDFWYFSHSILIVKLHIKWDSRMSKI